MTDLYMCDTCQTTLAGQAYKLRYYIDKDDKRIGAEARQDLCPKCVTQLFVKVDTNIVPITFKEKEMKPRA